jgi:shikimate kinase
MEHSVLSRAHLFLIGMKHSGKSDLGRRLAFRLGTSFYDLDDYIQRSAESEGFASVRDLYRSSGKDFFQEHECRAALALAGDLKRSTASPAISALGGGSVENAETMNLLYPYGRFLYLQVEEEVLARRILGGELPPFLQGEAPPEEMLHRLIERRVPLYERWADIIAPLGDAPREENSEQLYQLLREHHYVG